MCWARPTRARSATTCARRRPRGFPAGGFWASFTIFKIILADLFSQNHSKFLRKFDQCYNKTESCNRNITRIKMSEIVKIENRAKFSWILQTICLLSWNLTKLHWNCKTPYKSPEHSQQSGMMQRYSCRATTKAWKNAGKWAFSWKNRRRHSRERAFGMTSEPGPFWRPWWYVRRRHVGFSAGGFLSDLKDYDLAIDIPTERVNISEKERAVHNLTAPLRILRCCGNCQRLMVYLVDVAENLLDDGYPIWKSSLMMFSFNSLPSFSFAFSGHSEITLVLRCPPECNSFLEINKFRSVLDLFGWIITAHAPHEHEDLEEEEKHAPDLLGDRYLGSIAEPTLPAPNCRRDRRNRKFVPREVVLPTTVLKRLYVM